MSGIRFGRSAALAAGILILGAQAVHAGEGRWSFGYKKESRLSDPTDRRSQVVDHVAFYSPVFKTSGNSDGLDFAARAFCKAQAKSAVEMGRPEYACQPGAFNISHFSTREEAQAHLETLLTQEKRRGYLLTPVLGFKGDGTNEVRLTSE